MTPGDIIRRERKRLGWGVRRLATAAEVDAAQLGRIEQSKRSLTLPTAMRIAKALGVSLAVFDDAEDKG